VGLIIAPLCFNLCASWKWMVNFIFSPLYAGERSCCVRIELEARWASE